MDEHSLSEYVDRLYAAAVKKTGDSHAAEDIVQETFLAALGQMARGKRPDNLQAWLLRILSNKYCDWLREKYRKPQVSFEEYPCDIPEETWDDDTEEKLEAVHRELGYLARIHREVMVRFYLRGETLEQIARELEVPTGTVKSRLSIGRQHIREGVADMENYTRQSYEPDILKMSCSGGIGIHGEPFSLVEESDVLAQSILICAYPKPMTETELARQLGVPVAFVEPVAAKLVEGELMRRTDGGKVYTDFIIYTERDRREPFQKQLDLVDRHFDLFWGGMEKALVQLREKEYYRRQPERARARQDLHFCIKVLSDANIHRRDKMTGGVLPYSDYPYRKDGGRWFAMGHQYPAGYRYEQDEAYWKYNLSGEAGHLVKGFRDSRSLELRIYDTSLRQYPHFPFEEEGEFVKWLYELYTGVPREESAISDCCAQWTAWMLEGGVLRRENGLELDIPVLTRQEWLDENRLVAAHMEQVGADVGDVLRVLYEGGDTKIPPHLKGIPKYQQYMYCGASIPMAVIYKAREKGLFLDGVDYPLPTMKLIYEKA